MCKSACTAFGSGATSEGMPKLLKSIGKRGRSYWAAAIVLAMLAARALVPAGFMLAPIDGSLSFVLCEPDVMGGLQAHQHHHHPGHDQSTQMGGSHIDSTCPYAQSAGPAPLRALPVVSAVSTIVEVLTPTIRHQVSLHSGPTRQQSPRGPPTFA